jgi:hypothetical protein
MEAVMQQNRELKRRLKNNKIRQLNENKIDLHIKDVMNGMSHLLTPNTDNNDLSTDPIIEFNDQSLKEPKQPFSLTELRNILLERNNLKTRVIELEEEINQLKQSINNSSNRKHSENNIPIIDEESEELVVEGPINKEPEDKLFPQRQQNRILRLYAII